MELIATHENKEIYRDGDARIKLFHAEIPLHTVLREALGQAQAQETDLPVPALREVTKQDDRWAIISDFIEGEDLAALLHKNSEKETEYLTLFVELQTRVHSWQAPMLTKQREVLQRAISASGLDATTRYELHTRLDAMPRHSKLCHGDFVPSNIILKGGTPYIIDWARVTQGNAAGDAANTYLILAQHSEALADSYRKIYCEASDTARQYFDKWLPIAAGAALADCLPEDRAFYEKYCVSVHGY
ncbi:MAG: phosphotransferase [Oscillospiraceae bacterium]|jgi:aminoglycoside phosphotransferase (APT) family kinase protein|nr:phosphotransferase [Oscillospiraceae bacterium]